MYMYIVEYIYEHYFPITLCFVAISTAPAPSTNSGISIKAPFVIVIVSARCWLAVHFAHLPTINHLAGAGLGTPLYARHFHIFLIWA